MYNGVFSNHTFLSKSPTSLFTAAPSRSHTRNFRAKNLLCSYYAALKTSHIVPPQRQTKVTAKYANNRTTWYRDTHIENIYQMRETP